jgi:hypothetical protein
MGYFNTRGGAGLGDTVVPIPVQRGGRVIRIPLVLRKIPRGMGALLAQPGDSGLPEIVDQNGALVYSSAQVAANPSLMDQVTSSGGCPAGLYPVFAPGNQSTCGEVVDGQTVYQPQFNYPIEGSCSPGMWCMTGSDPTNPASYTWGGGGTPSTPNPATFQPGATLPANYTDTAVLDAGSIPSGYTGQVSGPGGSALPPGVAPGAAWQPGNYGTETNSDPIPAALATAAPVASAPVTQAAVAFSNTSRPGATTFQVGDSWQLVITGGANQPVSGSASQNGNSLGTTPYGSTDSTGKLVLTGTMDASTVGNWAELWTVGASPAPVLNFTVAPAPGALTSAAPAGSSATAPAASSDALSFLTNTVTIPGLNIAVPIWALGATAIAALWLMSSGGSRR